MDVGHVAPALALVVGAVGVLLVASFVPPRGQWVTIPVALAAVGAAGIGILVLAVRSEQQLSFHGSWALDGITHGAQAVICAATAVCLLLSAEWFTTDARRGELPAVVLLSAAGALLLAGAADTMEVVVGMLLVSVTGYTLAAYHRGSPGAVEAGIKYFLVGALTNTFLLLGVVLLYGLAGTTNLGATAIAVDGGPAVALTVVAACLVVGLGFEIGSVPGHAWVPDVSQAAPAPMAAFLTVVPKVGAVVALARVVHVLPDATVPWRPVVAVVSAATMTLGNLAALWQDDVRRLLGWSSVSQAGYALMAVVVVDRSDQALPALVVFLAGYAAANLAAFGVVTHLRGRTRLDGFRGLAAQRPWAAAGLTVALLSLVGVPPLGGFVGKLLLFSATIDGGEAWLALLAVANTVVSLFYALRVVAPLWFDAPAGRVASLGPWAGAAVAAAVALTVAVGVGAGPLLAALDGARLLP